MGNVKRMKYFAGGKWIESRSDRYTPIYNPSTGEVQAEIPSCTVDEVLYAIQCAKEAFPAWRDTPVMKRVQVMYRFRDLLEQHWDELTECCARARKELGGIGRRYRKGQGAAGAGARHADADDGRVPYEHLHRL